MKVEMGVKGRRMKNAQKHPKALNRRQCGGEPGGGRGGGGGDVIPSLLRFTVALDIV